MYQSILCCRTVTQNEGRSLANQFECNFKETSAAEDMHSVEKVFHSLLRDIARMSERQVPLQPLFISEDKGLLGTSSQQAGLAVAGHVRRTKSPKGAERKEEKEQRAFPRRIEKIFNKSFKIFN